MVTKRKSARKRRTAWKTADAKANLSGVIAAASHEPQIIHRHAHPVAVVLSYEAYSLLAGAGSGASPAATVAETLAELRPLLASEAETLALPPRSSRPLPRGLHPES